MIGRRGVLLSWVGVVVLTAAGSSSADAASPGSIPSCKGAGSARAGAARAAGVRRFADGGRSYRYQDASGHPVSVPVPPAGFRPELASGAELRRYDFPARPTDPQALAEWRVQMSSYRYTPSPSLCSTNVRSVPAARTGALANPVRPVAPGRSGGVVNSIDQNSLNWAGFYDADANGNNHWVAVQGDFNQPNHHTDPCQTSYESSWVGLGGVSSGSLVQAGTAIPSSNALYAWYEYLNPGHPNPEVRTSLAIHPGDHIHILVTYERANGAASFYIADQTTGGARALTVNNLGTAYYDGRSADFIDERPTVGGALAHLKNFNTNNWFNAQALTVQGSWQPLGSFNHVRMHMVTNGTTLAAPGLLSSGSSFQDNWVHCHG